MSKTKTPKSIKPPAPSKRVETYIAPPPPTDGGRIVAIDAHPDTFTIALYTGQTPHDARKLGTGRHDSLQSLLQWARAELNPKDLVLLEAGSNSFEVCHRLGKFGLRTCVLESAHVGKHSKTYADNDKMAAARMALVYLAGNAPCVWVPDEKSRERRDLLHLYNKTVATHTAATNALKGLLTTYGIRLGKTHNPDAKTTPDWIRKQREWTPLQNRLLDEHFSAIEQTRTRRKSLYQLICAEMTGDAAMMGCMKVLGIGIVNAFALLAIIGDIRRFHSPERLVAYIGLNPGQRQSGKNKDIRLGIGKRGRGDLRQLLIQGAQSVMNKCRNSDLGKWGWRLFARKGHRNIAVAAVARKLVVQVWHTLQGHSATEAETNRSFRLKLQKVAVTLGKDLRREMNLGDTLADATTLLLERCRTLALDPPVPQPQAATP